MWDPEKRVRGVGAWLGDGGRLVLHCGTCIWIGRPPGDGPTGHDDGAWHDPGLIGGYVYPRGEPQPRPTAASPPPGEDGSAGELLKLLGMWPWRRGEIAARLLLGWIGAAMIGGALPWRPAVWITGARGTGKSTLHGLLHEVLAGGVVSISDATAAGIWQRIGRATLPIIFDELEATEDNRPAQAVVKLARQAASGGLVLRGGADHKATQFVVRSCFLFSSINMPPLLPQDRSRLAILELGKFSKDTPPLALDPMKLSGIGAGLRRRLVDGWSRFPETLEHFREQLQAVGHTARGADQFGTLLACADILLHDGPAHADHTNEPVSQLSAQELAKWEDDLSGEDALLTHILTSHTDPYRDGSRRTVGTLIREATRASNNEAEDANRALTNYGLRVFEDDGSKWLAIANHHQGLAKLLAGSQWAGRPGLTNPMVTVLRRIPGAKVDQRNFGGLKSRCTSLPLSAIELLVSDDEPEGA